MFHKSAVQSSNFQCTSLDGCFPSSRVDNYKNSKNQNLGRQSEMGKSLGRECNFEEVRFELGTEYW